MNYDDDNIEIGRMLHELTYKDEKKNILIDDTISIDFTKHSDGLVIFEIKKSSKYIRGALYQLYYYLYYLRQMNVSALGYLVVPKEKKKIQIKLTPKIEAELKAIIEDIPKIISQPEPPPAKKHPYCKNCSYKDFCFV